ncbi:MAG: I78 family peptidase inhibitor [Pseudomonadota bacterium]|nr:I78 family peptidase inhibitor [Pseudomonadota bacterium]
MIRRLALLLLLAGCSAGQAHPGGAATCNADGVQRYVGKTYSSALGKRLQRAAHSDILRVIPAGTMVSMVYRPDRLNVHVDTRQRIERLACS